MMCLSKWISATLAIALLAGTAAASEKVFTGKVKSINGDNKTFVLTDNGNKDHTFKFADNVLINREGKESNSDLKTGDPINVSYDHGLLTWTAHYILVQEGKTKNSELVAGNFKSYDATAKQIKLTDADGKLWTFETAGSTVRVNLKDGTLDDIKIGDHTLVIMDTIGAKTTLTSVMVQRSK
jgi:hypothetical protein